MTYTAQELFNEAWPDVPWSEASPADKRLFTDHAESLEMFYASR